MTIETQIQEPDVQPFSEEWLEELMHVRADPDIDLEVQGQILWQCLNGLHAHSLRESSKLETAVKALELCSSVTWGAAAQPIAREALREINEA